MSCRIGRRSQDYRQEAETRPSLACLCRSLRRPKEERASRSPIDVGNVLRVRTTSGNVAPASEALPRCSWMSN